MSSLYPFSIRSWNDVYQVVRAKAEAARGVETVSEAGAFAVAVPRTTGGDALAVAEVFDERVYGLDSKPLIDRWVHESTLLAAIDEEGERRIYDRNRQLWNMIAEVAIALDTAHRPLPTVESIEHAFRVLHERLPSADEPPAPQPQPDDTSQPHEAAGRPHFRSVFCEPTWWQMAVRQLQFFAELRGNRRASGLLPVPALRNADAIALVDYWDGEVARWGWGQLNHADALTLAGWRHVSQQARTAKQRLPHETYEHNWHLWATLLLLATQTSLRDCAPVPWMFDLPIFADTRNARDWEAIVKSQREAFGKSRGADVVTGRLTPQVPRTTVADVHLLDMFWDNSLRSIRGAYASEQAYRRWKEAHADVQRIKASADPKSVYPKNLEFWEAVTTLAIQLGAVAEAPDMTGGLSDIASDVGHLAMDAARAVGSGAKDAVVAVGGGAKDFATGLFDGAKAALGGIWDKAITRPLMYAGIGLGGLAVLFLLTRSAGGRSGSPL